MTTDNLKEIASKYGTPAFLFDEKALKDRARAIKEIVGDSVSLCFSIKANPFLIPAMLDVTEKLEVCSPGELDICKKLSVEPGRIVYSGVNKTEVDVRDAAEYGAGIYTAESLKHVVLLQNEGKRLGKILPVLLRLNAGSQFGMSKSDLLKAIEKRADLSNIEIVGIHYFVGTQRKKLEQQKKELLMLKDLYNEIESTYGVRLKKLEYGPGLPVPYFENEDFSDTLAPVKELSEALKETATWCELTIEMGRFFTSECGYYLTKVMDIKSNESTNYCIIDGGMNHVTYLGQVMGMKIPVIKKIDRDTADGAGDQIDSFFGGADVTGISEDGSADYALCGSLCTTADVLVRQIKLQDLKIGDILAFCDIGAYSVTEGIYLFLSRTMPRILLAKEDGSVVMARDFTESSGLNCQNKN
ncbi:diaminopimelate decarboxylase [Butyrivibrio sp. CB08]|uniref:diaminopimelate decarboxylase family protein n=1 Tax=Butyrivibrio sp. CB08 TaxID=2364879 RepID=UPI000EAA6755|nr:alanine racemase [Butyrivibrio sp. CB08]RKM59275.1 diaminopimelate decarboxylase [Butyrivibrio sp. CB08]